MDYRYCIVDFTKQFQINKEFLDTIDFIPFLKQYDRLEEMMIAIEQKYRNINMPAELEGEIFNYYTDEEFKDYLEKRYAKYVNFFPIEDYVINYWENTDDY